MNLVTAIAADRRLFILRLLRELGGDASESVLLSAARRNGFRRTTEAEMRLDIDHCRACNLVTVERRGPLLWITLTRPDGIDVVSGRVSCDGVSRPDLVED